MTRHVLAAIDAVGDDWEVSEDAMRITHGETPRPPDQITVVFRLAARQYTEMLAAVMREMSATWDRIRAAMDSPAMVALLREAQAHDAPTHRTRSPVNDNRPRYLTPYGPPPRRTHR